MRKIMGTLAIAVLALTACSAPAETSSIQPLVGSVPAATITAAPAPVMTNARIMEESAPPEDVALFLKSAKSRWKDAPLSDDELIAIGRKACVSLRAGQDTYEIVLFDGTKPADNENLDIATAAQDGLCPETIPTP